MYRVFTEHSEYNLANLDEYNHVYKIQQLLEEYGYYFESVYQSNLIILDMSKYKLFYKKEDNHRIRFGGVAFDNISLTDNYRVFLQAFNYTQNYIRTQKLLIIFK